MEHSAKEMTKCINSKLSSYQQITNLKVLREQYKTTVTFDFINEEQAKKYNQQEFIFQGQRSNIKTNEIMMLCIISIKNECK